MTIREQRKMLESRYKYHIPYWEGYSGDFEDWILTGQGMDYVSVSMYHTMFKSIRSFFAEENSRFILFEDLQNNPDDFCQQIYDVINLAVPDDLDLNVHHNPSLSEPEIKMIKQFNRLKVFRGGGAVSRIEARAFRSIACKLARDRGNIDDFRWGTNTLFENLGKDFRAENERLAVDQVLPREKLVKYGYV